MYAVVVQIYVALSHSLINFDNTAENYVSLRVCYFFIILAKK